MKSSPTINNKSPNHDTKITSNSNDKTKYNKKSPVNNYIKSPTTCTNNYEKCNTKGKLLKNH